MKNTEEFTKKLMELFEMAEVDPTNLLSTKSPDGVLKGSWTTTMENPTAIIYQGLIPRLFRIYSTPYEIEDSRFRVRVDGKFVGELIEGSGIVVIGKSIEVERIESAKNEPTMGSWETSPSLSLSPWQIYGSLSKVAIPVVLDEPCDIEVTIYGNASPAIRDVFHLEVDGKLLTQGDGNPACFLSGTGILTIGRSVKLILVHSSTQRSLGVVRFWRELKKS